MRNLTVANFPKIFFLFSHFLLFVPVCLWAIPLLRERLIHAPSNLRDGQRERETRRNVWRERERERERERIERRRERGRRGRELAESQNNISPKCYCRGLYGTERVERGSAARADSEVERVESKQQEQ